MRELFLDFTNLYNSRMVYTSEAEAIQNTEIGEANNYILNDSFVFNKIYKKDKVSGIFYQNAKGLDNVACESQILLLSNVLVRKIIFIGFCEWGYFKEKFKLECSDGTGEYAKVYFSDAVWPLEKAGECCFAAENALYMDGCRYFHEVKMKSGKGYMYYYLTEFQETKKVNKIIFPENCLMHIFAITIEN